MSDAKLLVVRVATGILVILVVFAIYVVVIGTSPESIPTIEDDPTLSFVSGTEYRYGDAGQVIVEARNKQGDPVQTNCTVDVWYPNKTVFISNQSTLTSASGNSYINFTIPEVKGVYEYQANCTVLGKTLVVSKSFHVSYPKISAEAIK